MQPSRSTDSSTPSHLFRRLIDWVDRKTTPVQTIIKEFGLAQFARAMRVLPYITSLYLGALCATTLYYYVTTHDAVFGFALLGLLSLGAVSFGINVLTKSDVTS